MEKDRKPGGLPPMDDDMANELEVLRLMKDYQSGREKRRGRQGRG